MLTWVKPTDKPPFSSLSMTLSHTDCLPALSPLVSSFFFVHPSHFILSDPHPPQMKTWLNFRVGGFTLRYVSDNMWNISFSLLPSPLILGGDKSIAIYDSFVAAGRSLLPCLAVIPADSFRSVSLFKSCCNYTGFSICRRPDMIQTTATGRGERGAQRVNEKRDKTQWREAQEGEREGEREEMERRRGGKGQRGRDMVSRADW